MRNRRCFSGNDSAFTTGEGDRAGLGFTVMESFCDKINVKSKLTFGTTVTLSKKIEGKSKW